MNIKKPPLLLREEAIGKIRRFFNKKKYHEIWPNILVKSPAIEPYIDAFKLKGKNSCYFLATSPEFNLKKRFFMMPKNTLGIFAISPAFRDDPKTPYHAPEFTLVEWYHKQGSLEKLVVECYGLFQYLFQKIDKNLPEKIFLSLQDFFKEEKIFLSKKLQNYFSLTFYQKSSPDELDEAQREFEIFFEDKVRPKLKLRKEILFLHSYPPFLRGMAKLKNGLSLKVECFYQGVELANGYEEESSPYEIKKLFEYCNAIRQKRNLPLYPLDELLLLACENLPELSGMALGLERMLMVFLGIQDIQQFFV